MLRGLILKLDGAEALPNLGFLVVTLDEQCPFDLGKPATEACWLPVARVGCGAGWESSFPQLQAGVICISKAPDKLQRSSLGKDYF